jgi:hypothetical protein
MDWRDESVHVDRARALRASVPLETTAERRLKAARARLRIVQAYIALAIVGAIGGFFGTHMVMSTTSVAREVKQIVIEETRATAERRSFELTEGQARQRAVSEVLRQSR